MSPTSTAPAGTRSRNNFSNKACSLTACSPDIAPHTGGIANPVSRSWATSIFTTGKCDSPCWVEGGGNACFIAGGGGGHSRVCAGGGGARAGGGQEEKRAGRPTRPPAPAGLRQ